MFSSAQASVSLRPLPPIPTQAMFNLLLRFCARKSAGTPKARAPAARELVLMNSRRSIGEGEVVSGDFIESTLWDRFHTKQDTHQDASEQDSYRGCQPAL